MTGRVPFPNCRGGPRDHGQSWPAPVALARGTWAWDHPGHTRTAALFAMRRSQRPRPRS